MASALAALRAEFRATPYPPTGAAASAVALAKLVGRVEWASENVTLQTDHLGPIDEPARAVLEEIAATLHRSADLICDGGGHPVDDPAVVRRLRDELERLGESIRVQRDSDLSMLLDADDEPDGSQEPTRGRRPPSGRHGGDGGRVRELPGVAARSGPARADARHHHRDGGRRHAVGGRSRRGRSTRGSGRTGTPRPVRSGAGSRPTCPCALCGSATLSAARPGLRSRWRWSRSATSRTGSGSCWAPSRCSAPARSAPVPRPCAPSAGRSWGSSSVPPS